MKLSDTKPDPRVPCARHNRLSCAKCMPVDPPPPPVKDRPRCLQCNRPLQPWIDETWAHGFGLVARGWKGRYHAKPYMDQPLFCSVTCAVRYATEAARRVGSRRTHCQECGARITPLKETK